MESFKYSICSFISSNPQIVDVEYMVETPDDVVTDDDYKVWRTEKINEFLEETQLLYPNDDVYYVISDSDLGIEEEETMKNSDLIKLGFGDIILAGFLLGMFIIAVMVIDSNNRSIDVEKEKVQRTDNTNRMAVEKLENVMRYYVEKVVKPE